MAIIAQPIDFVGINYYTRAVCQADKAGGLFQVITVQPPGEYTTMGWEVYPEGLYELLTRLHNEYAVPQIYVTENGAAFADVVDGAGQVLDRRREAYLRNHFLQAQRALADGVPLRGYFVWSLLDNFEWTHGYYQRFGVIYVDFATQQRIVKQSGRWYAQVTRAGGLTP
jgi:beta-glucosidase